MAALDIAPDTNESTPPGFDPRQFPIISRHWFGVEPPRPWQHVSVPISQVVGRLRVVDEPEDQVA